MLKHCNAKHSTVIWNSLNYINYIIFTTCISRVYNTLKKTQMSRTTLKRRNNMNMSLAIEYYIRITADISI